jgi:peptidoglycan hydrolase-like protein with peptidoglycan-binding domain
MVTGVVFDDRDGDRRMDLGEGLAGVVVTTGGSSAVTNAGGGYALPLTPGESVIAATMDGITSEGHFTAGAYSVGVDFVKGASRPVIRAYELCEGSPPTILGTDGDDTITGTAGDDIIHGLAGNDTIAGGGGTDIICGGDGVDVINGVADAAVVSSSAPTTTSSTTVAPPPVINLDIRRGARGTTVRQLQSMLNSAGFPVGRADGIFGAKTQAAVSRFQGSKSLPQTGWVDGMTWTTLQALVSAPPPVAAIPAVATIAIRKGARGAMVAQLQTMLNATGFSVGRADGIFGLKTQSAVSRFQASRSLPQTGLVDAATWAVLQAAFAPVP